MQTMIPNGLKRLTKEDKQANAPYRVGALLTLVEAPKAWKGRYEKFWIYNQGEYEPGNDECGGCASSMALSILNGYHVGPHYQWMISRQRAGASISDFGVTNRDLAMTLVKNGALRYEDEPYTFKDGRDKIADPTNWNIAALTYLGLQQLAGSVIWVKAESGVDAFDMMRSSITRLNKLYGKEHAAVFGMIWGYNNANQLDAPVEDGTGHDVAVIGWDGDYAIMVQSYGLSQGDQGEVRLHRSIINRWAEDFGMFICTDASQKQIKRAVEQGGKLDDALLTNLRRAFLNKIRQVLMQITSLLNR